MEVSLMAQRWLTAIRSKRGQSMVEYALILVLVSVMVIAVLTALGAQIKVVFTHVIQSLGS